MSAPADVTRPELDGTIAELKAWVERARGAAPTPLTLSLALHGLGQAGLDRTQPNRDISLLLSSNTNVDGRGAAAALATSEDEPVAVLAILLEGGLPLDWELASSSGSTRVRELVEKTLPPAHARGVPNAWELELLSLSTLGGVTHHRERLARLTQAMLTRLDRRLRTGTAGSGSSRTDLAALRARAQVYRNPHDPQKLGDGDLHASLAVFRAVALLADPELEVQALRHLNALLSQYSSDRALHEYLLDSAADRDERRRVSIEALEHFGRLEQALYGAHLAFRRQARPEPDARLAAVMRHAARDAIDRHRELASTGAFERAPNHRESELLRAAVHGLRGLRTARIATPTL